MDDPNSDAYRTPAKPTAAELDLPPKKRSRTRRAFDWAKDQANTNGRKLLRGFSERGWSGVAGTASRLGEEHPELDPDSSDAKPLLASAIHLAAICRCARGYREKESRSNAVLLGALSEAAQRAVASARTALGEHERDWRALLLRADAEVAFLVEAHQAEEPVSKSSKAGKREKIDIDEILQRAEHLVADITRISTAFDASFPSWSGVEVATRYR